MDAEKENKFLKAKKIETGTVIDHINKGKAFKVLEVLGVNETYPGTVTVLMNVSSTQFGSKDIIKLEGRTMEKKELAKIALISPNASVNAIKNFTVVDKYVVQIPPVLEGVVACPNPNCVTNHEGVARLQVEEVSPLKLRCAYCEKEYEGKDLNC